MARTYATYFVVVCPKEGGLPFIEKDDQIGGMLRPTKLTYCQYLLSSQTNYTLTNFADHAQDFTHDAINRYLRQENISPSLLWKNVRGKMALDKEGYLLFDDTVLDKNYSFAIEGVRRQYSGNAHGIIKGIGVVNCVYVNSQTGRHWVIDYRVYNPDADGKSKLDHVEEMLLSAVFEKRLPFQTVLMDSWYAVNALMLLVQNLGKLYYTTIKTNRLVDESQGVEEYKPVETLVWTDQNLLEGQLVKLNAFPQDHKVKLFRVVASTGDTEYIVTNDVVQSSAEVAQEVCQVRWKIEQFHRELKQLTGIERCQCRKERIQRNHIGCSMLVWVRLASFAQGRQMTLYQVKHSLLREYLIQQLKQPDVPMQLVA